MWVNGLQSGCNRRLCSDPGAAAVDTTKSVTHPYALPLVPTVEHYNKTISAQQLREKNTHAGRMLGQPEQQSTLD